MANQKFVVYVNGRTKQGYMGPLGIVPHRHLAEKFNCIENAEAEIRDNGWELNTSVVPGKVTAYVAEAY